MKAVYLSRNGVEPAFAEKVTGQRGDYYALLHGEAGRGRWQVKMPLAAREFPSPVDAGNKLDLSNLDLRMVNLGKSDARNNPLYLIVPGEDCGQQLVLWSLSPGYRGSATYTIEGDATLVTRGQEAQGTAGRMGSAECPVVLVSGPARLKWSRYGRLYATPPNWIAEYDGSSWTIQPETECQLEEIALSW